MNLSAENIGAIRELVRSGYPLKARDATDLLGHNDHLVELLEARSRLMLGVEIERDQLRAEIAGLKTGYEAYERVNAELKAENEALRKDADRYVWLRDKSQAVNNFYISVPLWFTNVKVQAASVDTYIDEAIKLDAAMGKGEQS